MLTCLSKITAHLPECPVCIKTTVSNLASRITKLFISGLDALKSLWTAGCPAFLKGRVTVMTAQPLAGSEPVAPPTIQPSAVALRALSSLQPLVKVERPRLQPLQPLLSVEERRQARAAEEQRQSLALLAHVDSRAGTPPPEVREAPAAQPQEEIVLPRGTFFGSLRTQGFTGLLQRGGAWVSTQLASLGESDFFDRPISPASDNSSNNDSDVDDS